MSVLRLQWWHWIQPSFKIYSLVCKRMPLLRDPINCQNDTVNSRITLLCFIWQKICPCEHKENIGKARRWFAVIALRRLCAENIKRNFEILLIYTITILVQMIHYCWTIISDVFHYFDSEEYILKVSFSEVPLFIFLVHFTFCINYCHIQLIILFVVIYSCRILHVYFTDTRTFRIKRRATLCDAIWELSDIRSFGCFDAYSFTVAGY